MNSKSLRIVHTEASHGWGGQEIRILTEAAGMIGRGHQVILLCPEKARIYEEAKSWGIPVQALPIGRKNLAGLLGLRRWLKGNAANVVNTHSSTDTWLTALAMATLPSPPVLVRTRHISAPIPDNWPTQWLYQTATRHIITTGEKLRQRLITHNGYRPESITSVPTGIDTARFVPGDKQTARQQLGLPEAAPIVGIVATLRSWKGHTYLLDAFAELKNPAACLVIVGDGPQREALRAQAAKKGLGDRVLMPGNQRDVLPWLHAMDIFALPSYANEGVPQSILQAMLCGLPVVTTTVGSILEAVQDGETGLIVEPKNAEALGTAIERLLDDSSLRQRLGEQARSTALEKFSLEAMLDKMETVFRQVCPAP